MCHFPYQDARALAPQMVHMHPVLVMGPLDLSTVVVRARPTVEVVSDQARRWLLATVLLLLVPSLFSVETSAFLQRNLTCPPVHLVQLPSSSITQRVLALAGRRLVVYALPS